MNSISKAFLRVLRLFAAKGRKENAGWKPAFPDSQDGYLPIRPE